MQVYERPRFEYRAGWEANLPPELKQHDRWVLWKYVARKRADRSLNWTKMPFQARDPNVAASATDPTTWASFEQALRTYEATKVSTAGLGFVLGLLGADSVISGIDLDNCVARDGRIEAWAAEWVKEFASYSEVSPSSSGIKIFVRGCWLGGKSYEVLNGLGLAAASQIEIARYGRYFTVTGQPIGPDRRDLAHGALKLQALHNKIQHELERREAAKKKPTRKGTKPGEPLPREELRGLSPLQKFKAQLDAMGRTYTKSGDCYSACCPVHRDRNPSFSFRETQDGKLLLCCFACEAGFGDIMTAVGLDETDAFSEDEDEEAPEGTMQRLRPRKAPNFVGDSERQTEVDPRIIAKFTAESESYQQALLEQPEKLAELAGRLRVDQSSLQSLAVGWRERNARRDADGQWVDDGPAWTFPEVDAKGQIIGIQRRFEDESINKRMIQGSSRGLYVPAGWQSLPGPVFIPEGVSDVAAILMAGRCAIGRPSANGGVGYLAELLHGVERKIFVLAENDRREDGGWPGKKGAEVVARELGKRLGREIAVSFPPAGSKDIRESIQNRKSVKE